MQTNGIITPSFINEETNEYGEITASAIAWGSSARCVIVTNTDNRLGKYEDGEFRMSAYTVYIDARSPLFVKLETGTGETLANEDWREIIVKGEYLNFNRVRLERHGEDLGEKRVQSCEYFPRMGRIVMRVA